MIQGPVIVSYGREADDMLWAPYFEYVALAILCVQYVFYRSQRFLPMMSNIIFVRTLYIEIVVVCLDIAASFTSSRYAQHSLWLLYFFNEAYFFILFLFINELALYCRTLAQSRARVQIRYGITYRAPIIFAAALTFTTHWTGFLFQITPQNGYARGSLYYPVFTACLIYYISFIACYLYRYRKHIPSGMMKGIVACLIAVYTGFIAQVYFFGYVLLINVFSSLGLLILCLSLQNPAHDQDSRSGLYNIGSFSAYTEELARQGKDYSCIGFTFGSYQTFISTSGMEAKEHFLSAIGRILSSQYAEYPSFYFQNGEFVLVSEKKKDMNQLLEDLRKRLADWWKSETDAAAADIHFVLLKEEAVKKTEGNAADCLRLAFAEIHDDDKQEVMTIDDDLIQRLKDYQTARNLLTKAIVNHDVQVYYQPIYDNETHRIVSAEALARIPDGKGGVIYPDLFIPMAEKDGLILELGMQVFEKVCTFISTHDMDALGIQYININLSPIQCMHSSLAQDLLETAQHFHVDMHRINLEITGSSMMDIDLLNEIMQKLIQAGSSFSLDDYGTGFSNLINVLSLPFRTVKIDKSIAWAYFDGTDNVLPEIIWMFQNKHLHILVEGVETELMAQKLAEMHCQYEQGYYYSRPVPEDQFLQYLKNFSNKDIPEIF